MRKKLKWEIERIVREVIKEELGVSGYLKEGIIKKIIRKEFEAWGFEYKYGGAGLWFPFVGHIREEFNKLVDHLGLEWFKKEAEEGFRKKHGDKN